MSNLNTILDELRRDINAFICTGVIDIASGMALATVLGDPNHDAMAFAAGYSEVVKANLRALAISGSSPASLEDILISTRDFHFLIRMLGSQYFLALVLGRHASLGLARSLMVKTAARLESAIPK